jgi:polyferredoxin
VFNSKFYCKYLCPLGAALSFVTRFKVFDWLRRRVECGHPCQTCARECQIGAIRPTGEIIDNECHYCLDCQVTYWDEHRCPPLVRKRKKRFQGQLPEHAVIATDAAGSRRES